MARRVLAALALGAALALSACSGEEIPTDAPTLPDFQESLEELAPDVPADLATAIAEIAPDVDPTQILGNAQEVCQAIEEGKDAATLARDAAELFGVEEAEGPALVEAIDPHCSAIS